MLGWYFLSLSQGTLGKSLTFLEPPPQAGADVLKVTGPAQPPLALTTSGHEVLSPPAAMGILPDLAFPPSYSTCGSSSSSGEEKYKAVWVRSPWLIF